MTSFLFYIWFEGIKVFVHEPLTLPDFTKDGVLVSPGAETDVVIKKTVFERLE